MVEVLEAETAGIDNQRRIDVITFHVIPSIPVDRIFERICEECRHKH
jgi:hypothetical protein